ncbi:MAG: hypothetical protein RLZZ399_919 [Verrucomicrobiota bacterium]
MNFDLQEPRKQAARGGRLFSHLWSARSAFWVLRVGVVCGWGLLSGGCATREVTPKVRDTSRSFTTVVLDAGHGAHDSGARIRKGPLEKDLALDVVLRMEPKLRAAGFRTVLTRRRDVFIPLLQRAEISNAQTNAIFVSVHFNDAGRRSACGVESYYFSPESSRMASRMVGALSQGTGAPNRCARAARFCVLRNNANPAVLMECGYLSSRAEAALIVQPGYRERIAAGIVRGIVEQRGGPLLQKAETLSAFALQ